MKVLREEAIMEYETEEEARNHIERMKTLGWIVKDVHLKITFVK